MEGSALISESKKTQKCNDLAGAPDAFSGSRSLGIYVHVPYCVRKCRYCDFVSFPGGMARGEGGADCSCSWDGCPAGTPPECFARLDRQICEAAELYGDRFTVGSVFFGGGTPTAVDPALVCGALRRLKERFGFESGAEISLEANPGTLSEGSLPCATATIVRSRA